ncbi:MAG: FAD-dependent oxidoreductase [Gammaproteobacteria bacterium]|nr:FAD-dependent oxidoreductase [Gammaproteobacteria bacterium]
MMNRRQFLTATSLGVLSLALPTKGLFAQAQAHVVVLGGGVGGATFAKYLKLADKDIRVTVIEKNRTYIRPYGSTEVITGHIGMKDLEVTYDDFARKYGIEFVFDTVVGGDLDKKRLRLAGGKDISYDKLVVSPGIEIMYDKVEGYSETLANNSIPNGWIPGAQTQLLANQLKSMPQGGTFVLVAPPNPYRCPPGPYERAALVTEWCAKHNPNAKIVILDPKNEFVTDKNMLLGWNRLYNFNIPAEFMEAMPEDVKTHSTPSRLEWVRAKDGGKVKSIDAASKTVHFEAGTIQADVLNVIAPMRAGKIAQQLGLTDDKGWCPVNLTDFASNHFKDVYVLGDATHGGMAPKSGYSANSQAKVTAMAVVNALVGKDPNDNPVWENTCYALAGSDYGLFVADVFRLKEGNVMYRVNPDRYPSLQQTPAQIRLGAAYQQAWMRSFTQDCFA